MKRALAVLAVAALAACSGGSEAPKPSAAKPHSAPTPENWPPRLHEPYPDLELVDRDGNPVRLSSFKGKVILLEPVGMNCPACNAFAGANDTSVGGFEGTAPQAGLASTADILRDYAGISADDPRLVVVQLLLYDMKLGPTTADDARRWSAHFGTDRHPNWKVLAGGEGLVNRASYDMIPGFQLIDEDFVLRSDATGHHPRQSVYDDLMPALAARLAQR